MSSRRVDAIEFVLDNASDYVLDHAIRFVWDGWLMVAELREDNSTLRTYTWGLDLSGSLEGAGGIGGLAAVRSDADNATYYPCYDGNGNIRALISDNGTLAAKFEYSPFGRTLAAAGPAADACPFGFSTKYTDAETGMLYFGYRHYNSNTGRWLNRDPSGERSANTLYAYGSNHPTDRVDALGLADTGPGLRPALDAILSRLLCIPYTCTEQDDLIGPFSGGEDDLGVFDAFYHWKLGTGKELSLKGDATFVRRVRDANPGEFDRMLLNAFGDKTSEFAEICKSSRGRVARRDYDLKSWVTSTPAGVGTYLPHRDVWLTIGSYTVKKATVACRIKCTPCCSSFECDVRITGTNDYSFKGDYENWMANWVGLILTLGDGSVPKDYTMTWSYGLRSKIVGRFRPGE